MDINNLVKLIEKTFFFDINRKIDSLVGNNGKLVHYTSASVARNIIEKEELWMRKTIRMNDASEVFYGKTCIDNVICKQNIADRINSFIKIFDADKDLKDLVSFYYYFINGIKNRTYISCLSEHLNQERNIGRLSMWRAYGSSTGVALIINPKFLKEETVILNNFFLTLPVIYDEKDFEKIFLDILNNIQIHLNELSNLNLEDFFKLFSYMIYVYILSIKHPGFAEEREWRIILSHIHMGAEKFISPDLIERSVENINNIPEIIYKIKLNKYDFISPYKSSLLEKIIIGPSACADIVAESFEEILQLKGIPNAKDMIIVSNIPLRTAY